MLTLKNGTFYNDGQKVPLEFGNKDQINLIETVKSWIDDGAMPDFLHDETGEKIVGIGLTCVCGGEIAVIRDNEYDLCEIEGTKIDCKGCNFKFIVACDDYGFNYFKLLK